MAYNILTKDEQDEILATYLHAQERDHFCHSINRDRYQEILKGSPSPEFAQRIQTLLTETESRIAEVEAIIATTQPQIVGVDLAAAVERAALKAKG